MAGAIPRARTTRRPPHVMFLTRPSTRLAIFIACYVARAGKAWERGYILLVISNSRARACAAKGYCSRSVGLCVCVYLFPRFLSNHGCCRYQTWICGYVQRALGTARVWSGVVQEQHVYGGDLKLYTVIILGVH